MSLLTIIQVTNVDVPGHFLPSKPLWLSGRPHLHNDLARWPGRKEDGAWARSAGIVPIAT